ncbi:MAG: dihydroorotate dehydrogenase electron transfer subunit [Candidatus Aminicenantes bacterium]|nr:dihydroorotate dehydrogenase electron transfer subunit [Candidatus Aminicenantes bacterium]
MFTDKEARIVKKTLQNDFAALTMESPAIAPHCFPGQFLMVRVLPQQYPLLRRPLSIHDRIQSRLSLFFKITGEGTALLARKNEGDTVDILGPLGRGFTFDRNFKAKPVYVVGGGRGIAPLYFLAGELKKRRVHVRIFYGGKNSKELPLLAKMRSEGFNLDCSTEDGSYGIQGMVTDLLKKSFKSELPAFLYACGPEAMMKNVYILASEHGVSSEFSLESIMGCGIGACWGCVKRIRKDGIGTWVKICEDGPVFPGQDIIWEKND